ncbi:hypothetical protein Hdeb2414_s0002g00055851 [Helianthus debilis subsp. tardiflorus]
MPSTISRLSCAYSTLFLKPHEEPVFFKPVSIKPFLKNKAHAWNLHGKSYRNLQYLSTFVRQSNVNPPPEDPLPSGSPSGSLRNWIVGMVLTFIIPFFTRKWGSLLLLKSNTCLLFFSYYYVSLSYSQPNSKFITKSYVA